jgi:hypothetical protein
MPISATKSAQSRHGATSDLSPLCTKERKPFVRIGAAKALAQFGGVTPAVGKTPRQTAPSPQRSSVVAHFSDTRAMLPLASRARPTARPVRATYRFAGDQTWPSGDTSVASCGNFPNHQSWHATPHFCGVIVPPNGRMKRTAILTFCALVNAARTGSLSARSYRAP